MNCKNFFSIEKFLKKGYNDFIKAINENVRMRYFIIFLLIFSLCSCIGGGGGTSEEVSNIGSFNISRVAVEPTFFSRDASDNTTISFSWSLDNFTCPSGEYFLDVYLSRDTVLDPEEDFRLFSTSSNRTQDSLQLDPSDFANFYGGKYYVIFDFYCDSNSHTLKTFYPFTIKTKWTFMVYMDGDNTLSGYTDIDLGEMENVGSTPEVNVIVQKDDYGPAVRLFIKPNGEEVLQQLGEVNMGDEQTLTEFLKWGINNFPADHYVVVLWDHGNGFKRVYMDSEELSRDICIDDTSGDSLTLAELREAFSNATQFLGKKIDIIGMDACLMAMAEVAYEIKDYADYMVASENTEPGSGWPYNSILYVLTSNPQISPEDFAKEIVNKYIQSYSSDDEATQSAIDLAQIANVTSSLNSLAQSLINALDNDTNGTLKTTLQNDIFVNVQRFDDIDPQGIGKEDSYADLYNLAFLIKENLPSFASEAQAVMEALNGTVIISGNTGGSVSNATGLSIWFPNNSTYQNYIAQYRKLLFCNATLWDEFLQKLWE